MISFHPFPSFNVSSAKTVLNNFTADLSSSVLRSADLRTNFTSGYAPYLELNVTNTSTLSTTLEVFWTWDATHSLPSINPITWFETISGSLGTVTWAEISASFAPIWTWTDTNNTSPNAFTYNNAITDSTTWYGICALDAPTIWTWKQLATILQPNGDYGDNPETWNQTISSSTIWNETTSVAKYPFPWSIVESTGTMPRVWGDSRSNQTLKFTWAYTKLEEYPDFTFTKQQTGVVGDIPVTLYAIITAYKWDFGDYYNDNSIIYSTVNDSNFSAVSAGVTYVYTSPGTYKIDLTLYPENDLPFTSISTYTVFASELAPTIVINSDIINGDSPLTVNFSISGSTAGSYPIDRVDWSFGDDTDIVSITSDPKNAIVTHTFNRNNINNSNTFSVQATAYSANTGSITISPTYSIGPINIQPFTNRKLIKSRLFGQNDTLLTIFEDLSCNTFTNIFSSTNTSYLSSFITQVSSTSSTSTSSIELSSTYLIPDLTATNISFNTVTLELPSISFANVCDLQVYNTTGFDTLQTELRVNNNFTVTNLTPDTTYFYRVQAFNEIDSNFYYSNAISVHTESIDAFLPKVIPTFTLISPTLTSITINVDDFIAESNTRYDIYRSVNTNSYSLLVSSISPLSSYIDNTISGSLSSWSYAILATNLYGSVSGIAHSYNIDESYLYYPLSSYAISAKIGTTSVSSLSTEYTNNSGVFWAYSYPVATPLIVAPTSSWTGPNYFYYAASDVSRQTEYNDMTNVVTVLNNTVASTSSMKVSCNFDSLYDTNEMRLDLQVYQSLFLGGTSYNNTTAYFALPSTSGTQVLTMSSYALTATSELVIGYDYDFGGVSNIVLNGDTIRPYYRESYYNTYALSTQFRKVLYIKNVN